MKVVFRTDSSEKIASGHIERCLTFADYLKDSDNDCFFICRDLVGNIASEVERRNHTLLTLPSPPPNLPLSSLEEYLEIKTSKDIGQTVAEIKKLGHIDWLVVDHYGIDKEWEDEVKKKTGIENILVIDDKANRPHSADILLDQNLNDSKSRYDEHVTDDCRKLLGPANTLLRSEFIDARESLRERDGSIKKVLVYFGGVDADNTTKKVLEAIQHSSLNNTEINVIIGKAYEHKATLTQLVESLPKCSLLDHVASMAQYMTEADLAIGGGGTTALERAYLGLPSLIIILAENQRPGTEHMAKTGAAINLGHKDDLSSDDIRVSIDFATGSSEELVKMGREGMRIFGKNNKTGVQKLADAMTGYRRK